MSTSWNRINESKSIVPLSHLLSRRDKDEWNTCIPFIQENRSMRDVEFVYIYITPRLLDSQYWEGVVHGSEQQYYHLPW
jgi:hypothetical protein